MAALELEGVRAAPGRDFDFAQRRVVAVFDLDPAEAELVAGSARNQRSVRRSVSYGGVARIVVASMFLLAAIAEGSVPMIGMALAFLGLVVLLRRRDRGLDRRLARVEDLWR